MEKFTRITATACPLPAENIDTDQILPARYLKLPRKGEHGKVLFQDLRFDAEGRERPDFPLNRAPWRDAKIIVGGRNFGGGSSREAAVYALFDYGIRCVIAPSFGDIFSQNAAKNGLLTAVVSEAESGALIAAVTHEPALLVSADLEAKTITCGELRYRFSIDPARQTRLLNGWDDIDVTESFRDQVSAFKAANLKRRPWTIPSRG
ncbi:MAG TPA: 3-isopropylmalate dehydratase small subunit [Pseudolabrys sp.]|jgi:3-isopropylmalate/(R)-2-methylmalate dehydratase small subunit